MTLQALAKYQSRADVKAATERALACLSNMQDSTSGGFLSWGDESSESVVQVIVALCELGLGVEDSRFVKGGKTLLDRLMDFYIPGEGFEHIIGGGMNQIATEQALYALAAVYRFENKTAIEALAARKIISGMTETTYVPSATMTRAEFATIITRALGLPQKTTDIFSDVSKSDPFAPYVGTAYEYGIVNDTSETTFNPRGTITKQGAATIVTRAAKLCGMFTGMSVGGIQTMLAQFDDYRTVPEYAKAPLAFCYEQDILSQDAMEIEPGKNVTRGEIAEMLYRMLQRADLLFF